jgi:hypothetical protein
MIKVCILIAVLVGGNAQGDGAHSSAGLISRQLQTACNGICEDGFAVVNDRIVSFPITSQNITALACSVIDASLRNLVNGTSECTDGKTRAIDAGCVCEAVSQPQCANPTNTDRCAELTEFINYNATCPCLSFCQGGPPSCCPLGESCAVTCPEGANVETDVVSGCSIDPNKAPVTAPPATAPTSAPAATCVVQRNVENCPSLVANQLPLQSCPANACYNYCNGKFISCCEPGDVDCNVRCSITVADPSTPLTITAGCRLSDAPSCTAYATACTSATECCSKSCINGICGPGRGRNSARAKLRFKIGLGDAGFGGAIGRLRRNRGTENP